MTQYVNKEFEYNFEVYFIQLHRMRRLKILRKLDKLIDVKGERI